MKISVMKKGVNDVILLHLTSEKLVQRYCFVVGIFDLFLKRAGLKFLSIGSITELQSY